MANALGYVSETKTGFEGALAMMNLAAAIRIEKNAEKASAAHLTCTRFSAPPGVRPRPPLMSACTSSEIAQLESRANLR